MYILTVGAITLVIATATTRAAAGNLTTVATKGTIIFNKQIPAMITKTKKNTEIQELYWFDDTNIECMRNSVQDVTIGWSKVTIGNSTDRKSVV